MSDNITVKEIQAKSILNKSGIPGMTYCLNPYTGCSHGCIYCYATFMRDYSNHTEEWGHFVDVKINLPEILSREVKKRKLDGFVSELLLTLIRQPNKNTS